ncbi:ATPase, T2SS/T4P/T4SS family [Marinomonas sp. 2405UD68-3]|uniref:ATPase, T2SS/T4P/T4SS family n=1 Tax=Marinomonas sp. 2405UD68-3 TaxID=3391835 RepID=UPI0039C910B9
MSASTLKLVVNEKKKYINVTTSDFGQCDWDENSLRIFLVLCHEDNSTSDIFLQHETVIKIRYSGEILTVSLNAIDEQKPSMRKVPRLVLDEFFSNCMTHVYEITRMRDNATATLIVNKKNDGDSLGFPFRLEGLRHSMGNAQETSFVCLRPLRKVIPLENLRVSDLSKKIISSPGKFNIITGPTGAGKSTLASSAVTEMACKKRINVLTAEDPIEYNIAGDNRVIGNVHQFDANNDHKDGMSGLLKSFLRQRPDLVYVGEMREALTVNIGIQIARSSHKLFTTAHCERAWQAFERLIDLLPFEARLTSLIDLITYSGFIISQSLVATDKNGELAIQDVFYFDREDIVFLIDAVRKSYRESKDYEGYSRAFRVRFKEKCANGVAIDQLSHLRSHLDNNLITQEEFDKFSISIDPV